jgi:hypothetical protein
MNPREERGLIIAATCRLNRMNDGTWLVPSQSHRDGGATYRFYRALRRALTVYEQTAVSFCCAGMARQ